MLRVRSLAMALMCIVFVTAATTYLSSSVFLNLALGLFGYLVVPGLMLQLAIQKTYRLTVEFFLYSSGLTLAFWLLGGLGMNYLLPLLGDDRPLGLRPLLIMYLLSMGATGAFVWFTRPVTVITAPTARFSGTANSVVVAALAIMPIMSLVGTALLNNNGSGSVIKAMLALMALLALYIGLRSRFINPTLYPAFIFSFGISLLFMYSMRSFHVIGWDVSNELRVYTTTLKAARWQPSAYPGQPYNACLSITILPTIMQQLLHLPFEYVFKFIFQAIFAIFPVGVYAIARRALAPVLSLMAALLFCAQTWFFEQMPAVVRQEIAMVFFILILLLLFDSRLGKARRRVLTYSFVVCLIISHYSTAYVWLLLSVLSLLIMFLIRLARRKRERAIFRLSFTLIAFTAVVMYIWQQPITHTFSHAATVASTGAGTLGDAFSPSVLKDGVQKAFLPPPSANTTATIREANATATKDRVGGSSLYYPPQSYAGYQPVAVDDLEYAHNYFPKIVSSGLLLGSYVVKALVENLMTLMGIVMLSMSYWRRRWRGAPDLVPISIGAYIVILAELLLPYLQENYNITRLYLQLFSVLCVLSTYGFWRVTQQNARIGLPIISATIGVILVARTGLLDQFTGGALRITLAQPRGNFDTFYVYDAEVDAAEWLATNRQPSATVSADSVANLRLEAFANLDSNQALFPSSIPRDAYVYLIQANVVRGHAFYSYNNDTLVYNYPESFLAQNKNLIYNAGVSEIYK